MIGAGAMDQRVTLQRRTEAADGFGGLTRTWANVATDPTVWAAVAFRVARESLTEGRVNASQQALFTIYNRSDIDETCRILWNNETWNIRGLRREGARALRLMIEAERGVAE